MNFRLSLYNDTVLRKERAIIMKKLISAILAAAMIITLFSACGTDNTAKNSEKYHTLYFKDDSKSKDVSVTFFNSDTDKSEEVKMEKVFEDDSSYTFSCDGDVTAYNMAYITYDSVNTDKFAFNKCVSGWYNSEHGFLPYTEGKEANYDNKYDEITLQCNGYDKYIHIWKPDDYDEKSEEKYGTVYLLDGSAMVYLDLPGETLTDSEHADTQVQSMITATGNRAIVVAIDTWGDMGEITRDDELIPDLGKLAKGEETDWTKKLGGEISSFVANTLIPYVQQHYNVYSDARYTSIAGTSLGGLEAFYIAMENPDRIGTAGALSPSFWVYGDEEWKNYLSQKTLDESAPFIYFYTGNEEEDTGAETKQMVERLKDMGYPESRFALHYNENGGHAVPYWRSIFAEYLEASFYPENLILEN